MPFGTAKIEEGVVVLFLSDCVGVDAQGQFGAGVTELRSHSPHALARSQRQGLKLQIQPDTLS